MARLIGAPPGYVGYEEGGSLTEAVRRRPYSVILFDEVEKAHPDVLNVLLQVLDDGRLTDGQGRTVDFKNTVIIMTSNIGSHDHPGPRRVDERETMVRRVQDELRQHFRPEFLNRVDEIVIFHALSEEDIARIVEIQVRCLAKLLARAGLELRAHAPRPPRRWRRRATTPRSAPGRSSATIQRRIQNPLAVRVLEGAFLPGDTVRVDHRHGEFVFEKASAAEPETPRVGVKK